MWCSECGLEYVKKCDDVLCVSASGGLNCKTALVCNNIADSM